MHTFIIAATSIDGFLADQPDQNSTSWTSPEDLAYFSSRTKAARFLVMGSTTYQTIGHPLKDRIIIVVTNHPEKITSSQPLTPGVIQTTTPGVVYTTNLSPEKLVASLKSAGVAELAVCGGASIYTQFLQANLVDTIYLTVEPIIFGTGIPLFTKPLRQTLSLASTKNLNDNTLLLEYSLQRTA